MFSRLKYNIQNLVSICKRNRKIKGVFISPILKTEWSNCQRGIPYFLPRKWFGFRILDLGWKDKFNSPRYEWPPSVHFWGFGKQLSIYWTAPEIVTVDDYWEQVLWYLKYADEDIAKAQETWGWCSNGASTWKKEIVVK